MSLTLAHFYDAQGDRLVLTKHQTTGEIIGIENCPPEMTETERLRRFVEFKSALADRLAQEKGYFLAARACHAAKLQQGWYKTSRSMADADVRRLVDAVETCREQLASETRQGIEFYIREPSDRIGFTATFHALRKANEAGVTLSARDATDRELIRLFRGEVETHPTFGKSPFGNRECDDAVKRAMAKFEIRKTKAFNDMLPPAARNDMLPAGKARTRDALIQGTAYTAGTTSNAPRR